MAFFQTPPELGNQYDEDRVLRAFLAKKLPDDLLSSVEEDLRELGELAGKDLFRQSIEERDDEPRLVQWDAWGNRIDRIELTALWKRVARIAAEKGLVASGYDSKYGEYGRIVQFAKVHVLDPSTHVYSCPLAMTDGAAKTLMAAGNSALNARAIPRLLSQNPDEMWTSGQWMTERTGGSDVAITETRAVPDGADFRLHGTKWFTSATTSEMALTLARPEGNPPGGRGLALFYVETRDARGMLNGIQINRLKDKLGTRMVPTAELLLDGTRATAVTGTSDGIKNITPMLAVTRTWNAVGATSGMRRGIALARDYAKRRVAFGAPLADKPLHVDTLAGLEAEYRAGFALAFRVVELLGKTEADRASEDEHALLRLLTPLAKLTTGKQVVSVASEALEMFGGAGYVEDTGLPRLLRDAQVLPIWEGTTNVLSLDVLRALGRAGTPDPLAPLGKEVHRATLSAEAVGLAEPARIAKAAVKHASDWLLHTLEGGPTALEAGARRFALTLGRAVELALLIDAASVEHARGDGKREAAAARRFVRNGIDVIAADDAREDSALLASD